MNSAKQFVADVERDVKVIEDIRQTLYALELVNLVKIEVQRTNKPLIFVNEIDRLRRALGLMGVPESEYSPWVLPSE